MRMPEYYLDLETLPLGPQPDPSTDKIITIQYQSLDDTSGKPLGELRILKEWESSEQNILQVFLDEFALEDIWDFIPVGMNLNFDFNFIIERTRCLLNLNIPYERFYTKQPYIDIKPILVIMNKGEWKGTGLHNFTSKVPVARTIPKWYRKGEYQKIIEYVTLEAEAFVDIYQKLKAELPKLLQPASATEKIIPQKNKEVVKVLTSISLILESKGENPFKIGAYRKAAWTLENIPDDVTLLLQQGKLMEIKGIGESIAKIIEEIVTTGKCELLEKLKAG